jgi:hypothetical protein
VALGDAYAQVREVDIAGCVLPLHHGRVLEGVTHCEQQMAISQHHLDSTFDD